MARDAKAQISSHERECAIQWANATKTLNRIEGILSYGAVGLISTMIALIGYLYTHPTAH